MILELEDVKEWREGQADEWPVFYGRSITRKRNIIATNGCFDVLHYGHIKMLQEAKRIGGSLIVGINDDNGVHQLKGDGRPINTAAYRAKVLDSLQCVDAVAVFPGPNAAGFLAMASPNFYVKSGDYSLEKLDPLEMDTLIKCNAHFIFTPMVEGCSSTKIINQMNNQ